MAVKTHVSEKVLRFVLARSGGDVEAAQEIVQATWVAALKSYHAFSHKSTYFTWLCKIALRKLADYYRDQVNRKSKIVVPSVAAFNELVDPRLTLEEEMVLTELKTQVNSCLNLLPTKYRKLLQLRYYEALSLRDICVKLDLTPRSLEGKLYRAKKQLATLYAKSLHPQR